MGWFSFRRTGLSSGFIRKKTCRKDMETEADAGSPAPGGITIGQNFQSVEDMRDGLARFIEAGGRLVRAPFEAPWGLIAYAADPDGHVWEFAHVPGFEPNDEGQFILPSERSV